MDERTRYRDDVFAWSSEQADVLRRLKNRSDLPNDLDLDNVIEEIESVGSSELASVQSYLRLIFVHLIKLEASRSPEPHAHWREEIASFHADLLTRYAPSMRQHVDLDLVWRRAVRQAEAALADHGDRPSPPQDCPFRLDDMLSETLDVTELVSAIRLSATRPPS